MKTKLNCPKCLCKSPILGKDGVGNLVGACFKCNKKFKSKKETAQ